MICESGSILPEINKDLQKNIEECGATNYTMHHHNICADPPHPPRYIKACMSTRRSTTLKSSVQVRILDR